jgi:hypothetical protein
VAQYAITHPRLIGWRNNSGWTVTKAAHDNWALYIEFDNMCERHGYGGWLRTPMSEIRAALGPVVAMEINTEAGVDLA